jgi:glutamine cyclotransferase
MVPGSRLLAGILAPLLLGISCEGRPTPGSRASAPAKSPTDATPVDSDATVLRAETEDIPLPVAAGATAIGGGYVWVIPHLDAVALRLDPDTGQVVGRTKLPGLGNEMDANDDMVWISFSRGGVESGLVRLDARSGKVVAKLNIPGINPRIHEDMLWVGVEDGEAVYGIELSTNEVAEKYRLGSSGWEWTYPAGDALWISEEDKLKRLDPRTGEQVDVSSILNGRGVGSIGVAFVPLERHRKLLWGLGATEVLAVDVKDTELAASIPFPPGRGQGNDATRLGDRLFVVLQGPNGVELVEFDLTRLQIVGTYSIPPPEYQLSAGYGSVWIPILRELRLVRLTPLRRP